METTNATNTKKQWPVSIHESERELVVFANDEAFLDHIKENDPTIATYVELNDDDEALVAKLFAEDPTSTAVGPVSLDTYADQLGYN
jgi:hypothetical protein